MGFSSSLSPSFYLFLSTWQVLYHICALKMRIFCLIIAYNPKITVKVNELEKLSLTSNTNQEVGSSMEACGHNFSCSPYDIK